jgi:hypothetical protein
MRRVKFWRSFAASYCQTNLVASSLSEKKLRKLATEYVRLRSLVGPWLVFTGDDDGICEGRRCASEGSSDNSGETHCKRAKWWKGKWGRAREECKTARQPERTKFRAKPQGVHGTATFSHDPESSETLYVTHFPQAVSPRSAHFMFNPSMGNVLQDTSATRC